MIRGILISAAIFAPNFLMLTSPPVGIPPKAQLARRGMYSTMELVERLGQAGVLILPLFTELAVSAAWQWAAVAVMAAALGFYYAGWARFLRGGRRFRLLFSPMARVPIPMAVAPVVYFAAASAALLSWPLAVATVLFAVGHVYVSWFTWTHLQTVPEEEPEPEAGEPA